MGGGSSACTNGRMVLFGAVDSRNQRRPVVGKGQTAQRAEVFAVAPLLTTATSRVVVVTDSSSYAAR